MEEGAPSEESLAALRTALLAFYDEHTSVISGRSPVSTRRQRFVQQVLERLRLNWLPVVVALLVIAVRSMRRGRSMFGDVRPVARAYGELAGKDRDVAQAEVHRMISQLLPLDSRVRLTGELPRQVTRAEFELAADALLRFYVAGRHTDDPLLRETQAAYAEVEAASEALLDQTRGVHGSTSSQRRQGRERQAAANRGYVEAWLRWLDRQTDQSS
jgi:hypothetical protein